MAAPESTEPLPGHAGIVSYGTYLPAYRVAPGSAPARVAASYDEDSTTMAAAAAMIALGGGQSRPRSVYFATTSPAYLDKTNATAIHAALGLPPDMFAADLGSSARAGTTALRAAATGHGLAVLADIRVGLPGSADEARGGDAAAAFVFGPVADAVAEVLAESSATVEFLDRWRTPDARASRQWEQRFGIEQYLPLIERVTADVAARAGGASDHVVFASPNSGVVKLACRRWRGRKTTSSSPVGHSGAADLGLALAGVLDIADPGDTIMAVSAADGCDGWLLRVTDRITGRRQPVALTAQLARGTDVDYLDYLRWRGLLDGEPPRRPEPDRPVPPASARGRGWKFGFVATCCTACGFVHMPPVRVCKQCGVVDAMADLPMAGACGTVATFSVDRIAYSPGAPLVAAVVDFDGGGRCTVEIADDAAGIAVGARVRPTFRRRYTADGVHNYAWKARLE